MRVFASIAVLLTVTLGLHAQERNSLDIGIGPTFSAANIDEADGQKAFAAGTSFHSVTPDISETAGASSHRRT